MAGHHNVMNALAAIAVARELDRVGRRIKKGLAGFGGVKRRFTTTGVVERRPHHRRLRPPPGRDRRRPAGRASGDRGAR
jgi:hypothetical protein